MGGDNSLEAVLATGVAFQINNPKLYVPVVTLPINDVIVFFENLKQGFKRASSCINIDLK